MTRKKNGPESGHSALSRYLLNYIHPIIIIIMNTCVTAKTQVTMATARVSSASRNASSMVRCVAKSPSGCPPLKFWHDAPRY